MKFRCERDVLVEALATAGRAVTGARRRAAGAVRGPPRAHRATTCGSPAATSSSPSRSTITVDRRRRRRRRAARPASPPTSCARSSRGAVDVEVDGDEAQHHRRPLAVPRCGCCRPTSSRACPSRPARPSRCRPRRSPTALRQVVRAASSDDARPILTGVLLAAEEDGLRLVATDSYRLAVRDLPGTAVLREGQQVLVPSRALNELARLLAGAERRHAAPRRARRHLRGRARARLTTRLIEGEFPNYRELIPSSYPNRLTVGREALLDAVRRVKLLAREATPVRLAMRADGLELIAITQDVGQAHEELDAKYEGAELTVAFNPEYLLDGVEVVAGRRGRRSRRSTR